MLSWPAELTPRSEHWRLRGVALAGGTGVAGNPRTARTDGGGFWVCDQTIFVHGRYAMKAARALEAALDGGVETIEVFARVDGFGVPPEGVTWGPAITVDAAALRATTLTMNVANAAPLEGGERFSITHPTKGRRLYVVASVGSMTGFDQIVTIRPPLREAITTEVPDFVAPSCVMRLANPDEFSGAMDVTRTMSLSPTWVEAF